MWVFSPKRALPAVMLSVVLGTLGCGGGVSHSDSESKGASAAAAATEHPVDMIPPVTPRGIDGRTAIVRVGSVTISAATYAHWDEVLTPKIASYEPKSRADCSSIRAAAEVKLSAKQKAEELSNAQLRALCTRQKQAETKESALQQLISNQWVLGEAAELSLSVSEPEAQKQMEKLEIRQFKSKAKFGEYLAQNGMTVADSLLGVRLEMTTERLQRLIEHKAKAKINDEAVARYYHANKSSLSASKPSDASAPGRRKTFKEVEGLAREKLSEQLFHQELARFSRVFRRKWLLRTSCRRGYVIPRCREWQGHNPLFDEDSLALN